MFMPGVSTGLLLAGNTPRQLQCGLGSAGHGTARVLAWLLMKMELSMLPPPSDWLRPPPLLAAMLSSNAHWLTAPSTSVWKRPPPAYAEFP